MLGSTGFSQIKVWHYRVYLRFYLIKIKNVSANFSSEKQFKVKKSFFHGKRNWSQWRKITISDKHIVFEWR